MFKLLFNVMNLCTHFPLSFGSSLLSNEQPTRQKVQKPQRKKAAADIAKEMQIHELFCCGQTALYLLKIFFMAGSLSTDNAIP